ncbi:MAG: hypothetical protein KatS3mg108_0390 [Isosphaeraceae bacterium]|jgi:glucosamine-6-phosphate deaminase|nr:MAG: hypothetical protein KatS3mg108_0390 [Isosphaeraceae bacterium]
MQTPAGTVLVCDDPAQACRLAADRIASAIASTRADRGRAVLGLATGSTPIPVYADLVARHRAGQLSFANVTTYNLDEYYPIAPLDPNSYHAFMYKHLFQHVDLPPHRAHILDGTVPEAFAAEHCAAFDRWIEADGGIDLQLLGIGRNGHIGFNEPSDLPLDQALRLPTRLTRLDPVTIADAARDFGGSEAAVPRRALTLGTATILAARSILILAFGANKAEAVARAVFGPRTAQLPASLLQTVPEKVTWLIDRAAAARL